MIVWNPDTSWMTIRLEVVGHGEPKLGEQSVGLVSEIINPQFGAAEAVPWFETVPHPPETPCSVIPLVRFIVPAQLHEPLGMSTVSPSEASAIALITDCC